MCELDFKSKILNLNILQTVFIITEELSIKSFAIFDLKYFLYLIFSMLNNKNMVAEIIVFSWFTTVNQFRSGKLVERVSKRFCTLNNLNGA